MGGGINNNGTLVVERSIISGNRAEDNAGGISNSGTLTIRNSAIINNIAYAGASEVIEGGGGGILNGAGGNLIVVNTTISGNRTASPEQLDENGLPIGPGDGGGGLLNRGRARIINSTIVNNFAQVGSGVYSETTEANTILYNTIVALNRGAPDIDGFFDRRSGYNLISNANGAILDGYNGNMVGGATTSRGVVDVKLGPLQNNGGPTPTHALLPGSPAIDAGDFEEVNILFYFGDFPLDQRGSERISNGKIDIGAYEVFVPPTQTTSTTQSAVPSNNTTLMGVNANSNNSSSKSTGLGESSGTTPIEMVLNDSRSGNSTQSANDNVSNNTPNNVVQVMPFSASGDSLSTISTTGGNNKQSSLDSPIYRFRNTRVPGTYLYANAQEAESIRRNYANFFQEEGVAFYVSETPNDDLIPITRFRNKNTPGTCLYTTPDEAQTVRNRYASVFEEEGIAFYAYGAYVNKGKDLYRLASLDNPGTYLFVFEEEKNRAPVLFGNHFRLEGIAFEVA